MGHVYHRQLVEGVTVPAIIHNSCYIFYRKESSLYLTPFTVYADKTIQIEAEGDHFFTPHEIDTLFVQKRLCTSPECEEWERIEGLGEALLAPATDGGLPSGESKKKLAKFWRSFREKKMRWTAAGKLTISF